MNSPNRGLSEPPEGVLSGDSIPRENEEDDLNRAKVESIAGEMKKHPRFEGRTDAERREAARKMIERYDL